MGPSPVKRRVQQPLTIRVNLTEGQMDKLTEAISHKVDDSPKNKARLSRPKCKSPAKDDDRSDGYVLPAVAFGDTQPSRSALHNKLEDPLLDEVLQRKATLAKRRNRTTPSPIKTLPSSLNPRCSTEHVSQCIKNHKDHEMQEFVTPGSRSSYYEESTNINTPFGNLEIGQPVHQAIENRHNSGTNNTTPELPSEYPRRQQSLAQKLKRSQNSVIENGGWPHVSSTILSDPLPYLATRERPQNLHSMPAPSSQSSPMPFYFRGQGYPTTKRGEKTMIGSNGWLESTETSFEFGKKPQSKRSAFVDTIKKIAKDVTAEFNPSFRRPNVTVSDFSSTQLAISLDAREQSLLYCELEFHLTSALNDYLVLEFEKGHVLVTNLKKISDAWLQHGRPRVISFRYDLETQLELVALHLNEFSFYGRHQSNPSEISGLLCAMQTNARAMRIRTFCQPDSVIAKQLIDAQSLFNLLNVSRAPQHALAEIAHFFKTIVEREIGDREEPV
ncbi:hypothetical protein E4U42_004258 [Claviceps africana]|uniref:Uncharacterized protein n=1 Tax=Claviceps africana TaxID=83212 RepID=A0A8K0JC81_9HYPO|nr:hypothetical protein E4U42_004258 [Claviceps africana]